MKETIETLLSLVQESVGKAKATENIVQRKMFLDQAEKSLKLAKSFGWKLPKTQNEVEALATIDLLIENERQIWRSSFWKSYLELCESKTIEPVQKSVAFEYVQNQGFSVKRHKGEAVFIRIKP
jgi:hypothetical protein